MESTTNELITNELTTNELTTNESITNESITNESITNESITNQTATNQTASNESATNESANDTAKLSQAQLRAEIRRRKILQRGDERIRKLFGESKDEELNSVEERNKNLIEQIKKDPVILEKINSFDKSNENNEQQTELMDRQQNKQQTELTNRQQDKQQTELTSGQQDKQQTELIKTNDEQINKPTKPIIDLSYFEKLERKEKLKRERLELSRLQILIIHLINLITLNRDLILINLIKILIACLSSYFNLNIVTPFIISQSIGYLFIDLLNNNNLIELNRFKLSYSFFKNNLLDSFNFLFIYIIIQTLLV